jgi:glutathione S-transferase
MIKLFHSPQSRSMRVLWCLEEMGLAYELETLPFPPRVLKPDYLDINPLGTVPYLVDGDAWMTESSAACQYLATRYGPTPIGVTPEEPAFASYLQWLSFGEATLAFPLAIQLRYTRLEPEPRRLPQAVEDYKRFFLGRVKAGIEPTLADGRDYLCGRFTAADISVGYAIHLAAFLQLDAELPPSTQSYLARLRQRSAFQVANSR